MQSGRAEASIGIYGMVIYTGKRGEGSGATCLIPESTPIFRSLLTLAMRLCRPPQSRLPSKELLFRLGSSV